MALANIAQAEGLCERFDGVRAAYEEFLQTDASEHPRLRTWAEVSIAWAELITGSPADALEHAELALVLEGNSPSMTHFVATCHRLHALALLGHAEEALDQGAEAMERARAARVAMAVPSISLALAVAHAAAGNLDSAELLATNLLEMPQLHTSALMSELLVRIALERGEHLQAAARLVALEGLAERTGSTRLTALCEHLGGRIAAQAGNPTRARTLLQAALARQAEAEHQRAAAETLEELALVTPLGNEPGRRPRLAAAALHARNEIGCPPPAATLERLEAARRRFTARYGETSWDDAWREGEAMTITEAAAYARRARGSRNRSQSGLDALTPTEAEVAWLAATGLSNPEIGARLFMSRGTVKTHLSAVYAKLEIANRTQLAAVAARDSPAT
jgi:ATP/maltotriose-dependent transcriptional regulator MalT